MESNVIVSYSISHILTTHYRINVSSARLAPSPLRYTHDKMHGYYNMLNSIFSVILNKRKFQPKWIQFSCEIVVCQMFLRLRSFFLFLEWHFYPHLIKASQSNTSKFLTIRSNIQLGLIILGAPDNNMT